MTNYTPQEKKNLHEFLITKGMFQSSFTTMTDFEKEKQLHKYLSDGVKIVEEFATLVHIHYPTPSYANAYIDQEIQRLYTWLHNKEDPVQTKKVVGQCIRIKGSGEVSVESLDSDE